jgi:hypothetical protein
MNHPFYDAWLERVKRDIPHREGVLALIKAKTIEDIATKPFIKNIERPEMDVYHEPFINQIRDNADPDDWLMGVSLQIIIDRTGDMVPAVIVWVETPYQNQEIHMFETPASEPGPIGDEYTEYANNIRISWLDADGIPRAQRVPSRRGSSRQGTRH